MVSLHYGCVLFMCFMGCGCPGLSLATSDNATIPAYTTESTYTTMDNVSMENTTDMTVNISLKITTDVLDSTYNSTTPFISTVETSTGAGETPEVTKSRSDEEKGVLLLNTETVCLIVGVGSGFLIATIIIGIVCFRLGKSRSNLGKRYHVDSKHFRVSQIISANSKDLGNVEKGVSEKPDGTPHQHTDIEERKNINRSDSDKLREDNLLQSHAIKIPDDPDVQSNDQAKDIRINITDKVVHFESVKKTGSNSQHKIKGNGDVVVDKNVTKDENRNGVGNIVNDLDKSKTDLVTESSEKANTFETEDVYTDASSERLTVNISNHELQKESPVAFVTMSTGGELYEFALPVNAEHDNIDNKKDSKQNQFDNKDDNHYDIDQSCLLSNNMQSDAQKVDVTSQKYTADDDNPIYENDNNENNSNILPDNTTDDDYDNTLSSSYTEQNAKLYDSTKGDDYDITHHDSTKRFIISSEERLDNYDHCVLPSKDEDYDLVVLQEE